MDSLASNKQASLRWNRIYLRTQDMKDVSQNNTIELIYFPQKGNISDLFTKSLDYWVVNESGLL